jgi:hypothetical protein
VLTVADSFAVSVKPTDPQVKIVVKSECS